MAVKVSFINHWAVLPLTQQQNRGTKEMSIKCFWKNAIFGILKEKSHKYSWEKLKLVSIILILNYTWDRSHQIFSMIRASQCIKLVLKENIYEQNYARAPRKEKIFRKWTLLTEWHLGKRSLDMMNGCKVEKGQCVQDIEKKALRTNHGWEPGHGWSNGLIRDGERTYTHTM